MRPIGEELVTTITSPSCWGTHFLYLSNPPPGNLLPIIPCVQQSLILKLECTSTKPSTKRLCVKIFADILWYSHYFFLKIPSGAFTLSELIESPSSIINSRNTWQSLHLKIVMLVSKIFKKRPLNKGLCTHADKHSNFCGNSYQFMIVCYILSYVSVS